MIHSPAQDIFLTGGSGFLGHYIIADLMQTSEVRCRVMLRSPLSNSRARLAGRLAELGVSLDEMVGAGRIMLIECDLPDGLCDKTALEGVDLLLHAAASTDFNTDPSGEPARTNVEGTKALLDLASQAGVRHFLLISTAYVCGHHQGTAAESLLTAMPDFSNDYERSKWQAERLVWDWSKETPSAPAPTEKRIATICRPSILIGDRATGRTTNRGGIYVLARATEVLVRAVQQDSDVDRHHVPLRIIGDADATVNIVPVCWAARRISRIVQDPDQHGHVHHVTNSAPPSNAQIKKWLEEHFDIGGGVFAEMSWPWENPTRFEEAFYSVGDPLRDYFRHNLQFACRLNQSADEIGSLIDQDHFFRCLRYVQETNWGRRERRSSKAAHAETRPIDLHWYFEKFVPKRLPHSQVARVEALTTIFRFIVECETNDPDDQWVYRFENGNLCELHHGPDHLQEIFGYRLSYDSLHRIITRQKNIQEEFFGESVDIFGDVLQAMKMVPIIESFVKEFPVNGKALSPSTP